MNPSRSLVHTSIPLLALLALLALPASGQNSRVFAAVDTPTPGDGFGRQVIAIGDVFGSDGVPDFAVSSPLDSGGAGKVEAFDGATLTLKWTVNGTAGWLSCTGTGVDGLGTFLAMVPDQSGDGLADLLVLSPTAGVPSTTPPCENPFGEGQVLDVVNGNLVSVVAEASGTLPLLGNTGAAIPSFFTQGTFGFALLEPGSLLVADSGVALSIGFLAAGTVIAGSFDLDGDGLVEEFAIGDPASDDVHLLEANYSGGLFTGYSVVATVSGPAGSEFGAEIVGFDAGSLDGLLVGAPGGSSNKGEVYRIDWNGSVFAAQLLTSGDQANDRLGAMLDAGGDVDGDASPDFLTAIPSRRAVQVHDLGSGQRSQTFNVPSLGVGTITDVRYAGGDLTGDAFEDFFVGVENTSVSGSIEGFRIVHGGPTSTFNNNVGPGTGQGLAGAPALTTPFGFAPPTAVVEMGGAVSGSFYILMAGAPFPSGFVIPGYGTNALGFLDPNGSILTVASGTVPGNGTAFIPLFGVPYSMLGLEIGFQALVGQPINGTTFETVSNGISRVIGW